jgi:hypothetical protein
VKIGEQNLLLPLFSAHPGEEERLQCRFVQCRSKRHCFGLFLFLFFFNEQCMKRHHFGQNAPFHLKGKGNKNMPEFTLVLNL